MLPCSSIVFLVTCGVLLLCIQRSQAYYHGRHVCTERKKVPHPVPVTQSYRRPVYRRDLGRTVYVTAHRTVFKMEMKTRLYRTCCKGWEKRIPRETGCVVPVCKDKCLNGGHCIAPDLCMCAEGYGGQRCQTDIDECSGRNKCQQKCVNLPGTYECACQKGFVLADDELNCDLCLTCTPEFQALQEKMGTMGKQIEDLEQEKQSLQRNLSLALGQYEAALSKMEQIESRAQHLMTSPPTSTGNPDYVMMNDKDKLMPLDRLASLSQQISILEERIADCSCGTNDWY